MVSGPLRGREALTTKGEVLEWWRHLALEGVYLSVLNAQSLYVVNAEQYLVASPVVFICVFGSQQEGEIFHLLFGFLYAHESWG